MARCRGSSKKSTTAPRLLSPVRSPLRMVGGVPARLLRAGSVWLAVDCSGSNGASSGQEPQVGARDSSEAHSGERKPCHWACLYWRKRESGTLRTVCSSNCCSLVARFVDRRGSLSGTHSRKLYTEELWGKKVAWKRVDFH